MKKSIFLFSILILLLCQGINAQDINYDTLESIEAYNGNNLSIDGSVIYADPLEDIIWYSPDTLTPLTKVYDGEDRVFANFLLICPK